MEEKILLYYKYVPIEHPKQILKWQQKICTDFGLKGRILLADEGINGTIGGTVENLERYKKLMNEHPLFGNIDWKDGQGGAEHFPRLSIRVKNEIVHLDQDKQTICTDIGGVHLTPEQVHALLEESPEDLVILDTRNDYEYAIGTFKDAVLPPIKNFREFPKFIEDNIDMFKDKRVLMFCTGGVRCERATSVLTIKNVAKQVYQIQGGIHRYVEKYPDGFFRGKNYIFDGRIAVRVNEDVIGHCYICNASCDDYTNCINSMCNLHYIGCADCLKTLSNSCSTKCDELVKNGSVKVRTKRCAGEPITACSL